jgi:uncharacterized protein with GYD domain
MLIMQVTKHPPQTCPVYDPKFRAVTVAWYEKVEAMCAKYGVKFHGSYTNHGAHTVYVLYEAPTMEAVMGMMMEPEMNGPLAFCTSNVFPVFNHLETLAMLKK